MVFEFCVQVAGEPRRFSARGLARVGLVPRVIIGLAEVLWPGPAPRWRVVEVF